MFFFAKISLLKNLPSEFSINTFNFHKFLTFYSNKKERQQNTKKIENGETKFHKNNTSDIFLNKAYT